MVTYLNKLITFRIHDIRPSDRELDILNRIVSMYLDYVELQAIEEKL